MAFVRRHRVSQPKWARLRDQLPDDVVEAGDRYGLPVRATVDGYQQSRHFNALALDGALAALAGLLCVDLAQTGRAAGAELDDTLGDVPLDQVGRLGLVIAALGDGVFADGPAELAAGLDPAERAAVRRRAAAAAGELGNALRRAAVRAETLELGLTLRAEDLEGDARVDAELAARRARAARRT